MDPDSYILASLTFLLVTIALAFFSAAEAAFSSLLEIQEFVLKKRRGKRGARLKVLLDQQGPLLLSLRFGKASSTIAMAWVTLWVCFRATAAWELSLLATLPVAVVFLLVVLFVIDEILAGRLVLAKSLEFAEITSILVLLYYRTVSFLIKPLDRFVQFLSRRLGLSTNGLAQQRILAIVEDGDEGDLEEDERAMIHSIIEFGETEVHEIMVPRTDMVCVEERTDLANLTKLIEKKGHSRIPLYAEDVDNILGVIYAKDLFRYRLYGESEKIDLKEIARKAYFVPESKKIDDLLREFRQEKHHMAIVVDEYGGTAGLVTLEDVLEEIVGDIQDEHDMEVPLVRTIEKNLFVVDAKIDVHDLNETLGIELPTEGEYESLAGLILSITGYVPEQKETVTYGNYTFVIDEVHRNRILRVKLSINPIPAETEKPEEESGS